MNDQVTKGIDTQIPGLTSDLPRVPTSPIGYNPLGEWTPPPYVNAGELSIQQFTLGVATTKLGFVAHEHLILDNQGLVTIQVSKDGASWFDWLPSGRVVVMDFHRENFLYVRASAGTCVMVVTTW